MEGSIAQRVEQIVATFKAAREVAEAHGLNDILRQHLTVADAYYLSVAYEGAAMGLALRDFSQWKIFLLNDGAAHAVQVHIGLGWALADQQKTVPKTYNLSDPDSVADGYGYYHGLFRRRLTIRTQGIPDTMYIKLLPGFDRGVGRSMWYICKGDVEQLRTMVMAFPESRQSALWLGVGIAVAFVGGCSETLLGAIASEASVHKPMLLEGAKRALHSRSSAGTPTADAEAAVRVFESL